MNMQTVIMIMLLFAVAGCAALKLPFTENSKRYQVAQTYFERGDYKAAYDAYQAIAATSSAWAEDSKFNAGYVLIYYKNQQKDYGLAEQEFEVFLARYPKGALADEAFTWLDMLKMFHQTKAGELAREVATLTMKSENLAKDLMKTQSEREGLKKERAALLDERTSLLLKIDGLLNEKEALIKKNTELAKDKAGLARDKTVLTRKAELLNKEKAKLLEAKAALEKSLRDLTMVDVKMEKQRTKMKKEEIK
jgi:hypothetical protein